MVAHSRICVVVLDVLSDRNGLVILSSMPTTNVPAIFVFDCSFLSGFRIGWWMMLDEI